MRYLSPPSRQIALGKGWWRWSKSMIGFCGPNHRVLAYPVPIKSICRLYGSLLLYWDQYQGSFLQPSLSIFGGQKEQLHPQKLNYWIAWNMGVMRTDRGD